MINSIKFFNYKYSEINESGAFYEGEYFSLPKNIDIIDLANDLKNIKPDFFNLANKIDIEKIEFQTPVLNPGKVICVGLNYRDHVKELSRESLQFPTFFSRFNHSFVPHLHDIGLSALSEKYDYEAELAIIIGKPVYKVPKPEAIGHIAGYSIFNDVTVRDYQVRTSQWFLGKNFYQAGSFGPFLVPAANLNPNAQNLKIETIVNGVTLQSANTSQMIFKPDELIFELACVMPLNKGDVIITGTPGGVALSRTPRTYLKEGDSCIVSIENIGRLENKFIREKI